MFKEGEMVSTREAYGKKLAELGERNQNIVVVDADLSRSTKTIFFARRFPNRFFNLGVSEADMIGTAAGLALSGKVVFASTFAVFAPGRTYDQIRVSVAYSNANVKICSSHSGITVGQDGATHQALEDIALMRALPNMRVLSPADANETFETIERISEIYGPFYVRLSRPKTPVLPEHDFNFGKASTMLEGDDITIIATGFMVNEAMKAAKILKERGISARVVNIHMIKPIDEKSIIKAAKETGRIITVEDHSIIGGLGGAVCEVLAENYPVKVKRMGIRDAFGISGKPYELLEKFEMSANHIVKEACNLIKRI